MSKSSGLIELLGCHHLSLSSQPWAIKELVKAKSTLLYDADYELWLQHTVAQLKARDFSNLDLENLIEEIESLGHN